MAEDEKFRFLTNTAFERLTQPQKLAYLSAAVQALHGTGHGWGSVFANPAPGTTPLDPASKTHNRRG